MYTTESIKLEYIHHIHTHARPLFSSVQIFLSHEPHTSSKTKLEHLNHFFSSLLNYQQIIMKYTVSFMA